MSNCKNVIVGTGSGALCAALRLAARDREVLLLERSDRVGGKIRGCRREDLALDAGPTVMSMPWIFDELLEPLGESLSGLVDIEPLDTLARHFWSDGTRLDLCADADRTAAMLRDFAGDTAVTEYRRFATRSRAVYRALDDSFLRQRQAGLIGLLRRTPLAAWPALGKLQPFTSLWTALESTFTDPRLRQLFARYSTYCGSSPFLAPATLMLIAHVESLGVYRIDGGMRRLATALARCASAAGAQILCDRDVVEIEVRAGRATGVRTSAAERFDADAVLVNADTNALASGLLGQAAAASVPGTPVANRSLSAITMAGRAREPLPWLAYHNVFFSDDYAREFGELARGEVPEQPTIYACAPDSGTDRRARLFLLINAPPDGDRCSYGRSTIDRTVGRIAGRLGTFGITIEPESFEVTTPADFHLRYPATGGALYGPAMHGWRAAFRRPPSRTRIPGLFVAGGSVHPGSGVPMAAMSGRLAADAIMADGAARRRGRRVAASK